MIVESELESFNYDDILLLPKHSENIGSRDDINLYTKGKSYMNIFSAPMKNISEIPFIIELDNLGSIGILHRFFLDNRDRYEGIDKLSLHCNHYGIAIGLHDWDDELEIVKYAANRNCKFVVIDTASAYLKITLDAVKNLYNYRQKYDLDFSIIAGNVVDEVGCNELAKNGADIIRVNIGSGLQCLTARSVGCGCPTLTAIRDSAKIKDRYPNIILLADGGIYNPGQALKALAFGADGVMIGSLFGRAKECENNGLIYGMSSFELADRMNKTKKSKEGTFTIIPKEEIRPLKEIFDEFTYGIKSGLSYIGCDDINKIHDIDIEYIKIRP